MIRREVLQALGAALLLAACGQGAAPAPAPAAATPAGTPVRSFAASPSMQIDTNKGYTATLDTTKGTITIELQPKTAPLTVNNFVYLVRQRFYDGLKFHRVVAGFVIQGGDPAGNGSGGPGYTFKDEPVTQPYKLGTVAMANAGPNTNGSQFFICLADLPQLPPSYTIFGQTTGGIDVVQKIQIGDVIKQATIKEH